VAINSAPTEGVRVVSLSQRALAAAPEDVRRLRWLALGEPVELAA
jgi:hypothetical protein